MTAVRSSRRDLLKLWVVAASAGAPACSGSAGETDRERGVLPAAESAAYFPQSLASGDPRPESVVLWTRLEDASLSPAELSLVLEVGLDETLSVPLALDATANELLVT